MRPLSPEEAELWGKVAATIRPLSREPERPGLDKAADEATPPPPPAKQPPRPKGPAPRRTSAVAAPKPVPGTTLDGGWDRRLRSGSVEPDRVLDLHGHNLDSAWSAIDRVLEQAIASGDRIVLLITGHARSGDPPVQRGRIRAAVHNWLAASRHAGRIAAVRGAHNRHGGGGSLYIVLRRS